ncbi:DUF4111 domain-containing protein [Actinoplanes hulinensis]|uniref:DUF4111 domain-containing protein n=1 Tax=Actinoplanes hulinensis TaxID=1144547 RepID=A0ABS7B1R1_9ACTN|nr:aminoglycoside adenylyltransferase domain-containing protein [Actinoplanes hulinensis]MBW6434915.1 DUF4111 domain-containing protein [Actinoplanes hulinensis]
MTAAEGLAHLLAGAGVGSVVLHGSLAAGGFRPEQSDIDLLAVLDGGLTDTQAAEIERLVRQADVGGAAGIDLDVVAAEVAGAPDRMPALELHLSRHDGPPAVFEAERRVRAAPDLLAELSMARAHGRAIVGAAPHEVIAPVPAEWIIERGRYWLTFWRSQTDDVQHAAFMVLTACRMWRFAVEGVHCPKAQAARWAMDRDTSLVAIRQALRQLDHGPAVVVAGNDIADLLDVVLNETAQRG